ncbi:MAG: zinc ribbon domain-containing protein [Planctomycetota bacterium]|jgi:predicted  nucleic acid-binding Zn-ribbon protein
MGGILDALHRLQEIETQLNRLRREEEQKARVIRNVARQVHKIDQELARLEAEQAARQAEVDQLDQDVKTREAVILRHREALLKARTNKDYAAILTSINTEKADTAKIERLALDKLGEVERLSEQATSRAQQRDALEQRQASYKLALEDYRQETADERERLQAQRDIAANDLPSTALATFTRVADKHEGEALAEMVRLHPKREEYACCGCNMTVTLESVNALRSRDEIQFCKVCGRILYLGSPAAKNV